MEPAPLGASTPAAQTPTGVPAFPTTPPVATPQMNSTPDSVHVATMQRKPKPWAVSDSGLSFIGEWESGTMNGVVRIFQKKGHIDVTVSEGMILQVYLDNKGNPTVGCGHLVVPADHLKTGDVITANRAKELLAKDLNVVEAAINSKVNVPLYQYEYDALVSILFNTGASGPADDISDEVNSGSYERIPAYIKKFRVRNKKLLDRRESEANMFGTGVYDASH